MPNERSSKASSVTGILDRCEHRDVARARLLAVLKAKARISFRIKRRYIHPDDPRNMIRPLRVRRDYTSVGRPTFLLSDLPDD